MVPLAVHASLPPLKWCKNTQHYRFMYNYTCIFIVDTFLYIYNVLYYYYTARMTDMYVGISVFYEYMRHHGAYA